MPRNLNSLRTTVSGMGIDPDRIAEFLLRVLDEQSILIEANGDAEWQLNSTREQLTICEVRILAEYLQNRFGDFTNQKGFLPHVEIRDN